VKLGALGVFLVLVAVTDRNLAVTAASWLAVLCGVIVLARLPLFGALARSALVLPFSITFALVSWLAGDPARAFSVLAKSYLSAVAVLAVVATTPLPQLLHALELLKVPKFLLMVTQFLYRYLFVISEEAQHMRVAALSRGASAKGLMRRSAAVGAAAGALAVLFARSYERAGEIHRAMLARGFQGEFRALASRRLSAADAGFFGVAAAVPLLVRWAIERAVP
jgi:cobalt/nickel transport system permease protein